MHAVVKAKSKESMCSFMKIICLMMSVYREYGYMKVHVYFFGDMFCFFPPVFI